jgi:group I intron endonuclease
MELLKKNVKSGIYKITNLVNNKFYIGSSNNIYNRFYRHLSMLNRNCHNNQKLQNSWNKHGKSNFKFELLAICPKEYCIKLEQWFINTQKPQYNISQTAASTLGCRYKRKNKLPDETVNNILNNYKEYTNKELAKKYNTTISTIDSILYGKNSFIDFDKSITLNSKPFKDSTKSKMKNLHFNRKSNKITNGVIKLTIDDVKEIKKLYILNYPTKKIALQFNVSKENISSIINKRTWKEVPDYIIQFDDIKYSVKRKEFNKYDEEIIQNILFDYYKNNFTGKDLKNKYNLGNNIYKIIKGEHYKEFHKQYK